MKLDLRDKKLLFALDFDARATYAKLGKEAGLSKQGAEYKLKTLMKNCVIKGFYPVINVPKLGYTYCRLLITLQSTERREEIISYLKKHRKVFWLFQMQGVYDLLVAIWVKQLAEFKEFTDEIESKFGESIRRKTETIATDVTHLQHRYLLGKAKTKEIHIKEHEASIDIDEVDKAILRELSEDARMQIVDIARRIKQSAKVVAYRLRRLEKTGILEACRPIIDHNKLGLTYYKLFITLNRATQEQKRRLVAYIKENSAAIYIVEGIGLPGDLDVELMVESNQQLFAFIEGLRKKFSGLIGDYTTVIFMDTFKVRYLPF